VPNIFTYDDYRAFLHDTYLANKAQDQKFSFRYFAGRAGFKSHNFLRLVIAGKSNLSEKSTKKIAAALKLNREETLFFKNLVLLNQAKNRDEMQHFARELRLSKSYQRAKPLREAQYQFFTHWYFSVVRDLVGLPAFQEDPEWIARQIVPPITRSEAQKALEELIKLGLLKREDGADGADGKLVQADAVVSTPDEVSSLFVSEWHREFIRMGAESITRFPRDQREISAICVSFSKRNIEQAKELVRKFRKELLDLAYHEPDKDALIQLNLQLFPVAMIESETPSEEGQS
jgi:uncharacterized protein (TIGR02147 family)